MNKEKYFHVYGKVKTEDGQDHVVTIVGEFKQSRESEIVHEVTSVETKPNSYVDGLLAYNVKNLKRRLTIGMSICHPYDKFDEEIGIKVAKSRIEKGDVLGTLETSDVTMLTKDAIMAELMVKLNHVMGHIDQYLP